MSTTNADTAIMSAIFPIQTAEDNLNIISSELKLRMAETVKIFKEHSAMIDGITNEIERLKLDPNYTDEYKQPKLEYLKEKKQALRADRVTDILGRLKKIHDIEKQKYDVQFSTPEHQTAISNAMKAVELLGKHITQSQMQGIANTFILAKDFQTLSILKSLYIKLCERQKDATKNSQDETLDFGEQIETSLTLFRRFSDLITMQMKDDFGTVGFSAYYLNQFLKRYGINEAV